MNAAFDPFTATFDEAVAALHADPHASPNATNQWLQAQRLLEMRERVERGSGFDVLEGVAVCAAAGLVMPTWLAQPFLRRYRQVEDAHVPSWDDGAAFGRPYPPNFPFRTLRQKRELCSRLYAMFRPVGPLPRTDVGWKAAAEVLGISPRQVEDWTPKTRANRRRPKPTEAAVPQREAFASADPFNLTRRARKPR